MNTEPSFASVIVSFPLLRRERSMILRALDLDEQKIHDLVNRFPPNEPLVLSAEELDLLAGTLTAKALQKSKPTLMKLAERMDHMIGQARGPCPDPESPIPERSDGASERDSERRRLMQNAFAVLAGASTLAELNAALRPKADRSVHLVPDFEAMARAFRKATR